MSVSIWNMLITADVLGLLLLYDPGYILISLVSGLVQQLGSNVRATPSLENATFIKVVRPLCCAADNILASSFASQFIVMQYVQSQSMPLIDGFASAPPLATQSNHDTNSKIIYHRNIRLPFPSHRMLLLFILCICFVLTATQDVDL